jgi:ribosomal protein S18 acetylase RimI-like enzyme
MSNLFQKALNLFNDRSAESDIATDALSPNTENTSVLNILAAAPADFAPASQSIKYQWVYNLTPANCQEFEPLTFPSLQKRWQTQPQRGHIGGVVASIDGAMIGLVIVELLPEQADIISLFVAPEHRHQGIATQLLVHLERGLRKLNCPKIQIGYQVTELTENALETILRHQNWQPPKMEFLLTKTTIERLKDAPWVYQYPLPSQFEVFPWVDLTVADHDRLVQNQSYPDSLNPFSQDPRIEPINSLGLRYQGEIVGWTINHRVAADTIRYSTMFVERRFQRMGRGFSLLGEAIKRQINSGIPYATTAVASDNPLMLACADRHYKPYATYLSEARSSFKTIDYPLSM